jgi:hypothetical protein
MAISCTDNGKKWFEKILADLIYVIYHRLNLLSPEIRGAVWTGQLGLPLRFGSPFRLALNVLAQ